MPVHFISGLPRSGSTLLAAILNQNPDFKASISSPVSAIFGALQHNMSEANEGNNYITDTFRHDMLRNLFGCYYVDHLRVNKTVFDTSRAWTAKLDVLFDLFPSARMIVMVRSNAWILDSVERLVRKNAIMPSKMFRNDARGNVYSRVAQMMEPNGMVMYAYNCTREAWFSNHRDRLLFVRYETLAKHPARTMNDIMGFIDSDFSWKDPIGNLDPIPYARHYDNKLGMMGLHDVGDHIHYTERETILPYELFAAHDQSRFWDVPELNTKGMRVI